MIQNSDTQNYKIKDTTITVKRVFSKDQTKTVRKILTEYLAEHKNSQIHPL